MTPLYLFNELASEAMHAEWMRGRGRRGFDARQFREQIVRAAESFGVAAEAMAEAVRGLAVEFSRWAERFARTAAATGRQST